MQQVVGCRRGAGVQYRESMSVEMEVQKGDAGQMEGAQGMWGCRRDMGWLEVQGEM